jgi:hypothetical protein
MLAGALPVALPAALLAGLGGLALSGMAVLTMIS